MKKAKTAGKKRPAAKARRRPKAAPKARGRKAPAPSVPKTPVWDITPEQQIVGATLLGKVQNYLGKAGAMTLVVEAPLAVGETIRVKGHTTDLTQRVERMEVSHQAVQSATPGEAVAVAVADRVRAGDAVYKL